MKQLNTEKIKYLLYARKSSESEDRQVASIDSQIDELTKLAQRDNLEVIDILAESQSAKAPGRPVFSNLITRIHNSEAQGILCWKLDRLARNPVDGGNINWMLQQGMIRHIKTHERSYYPTDNVLMMSVEFGMANQFIRDLSQNAKRGLRAKAERGWYPTYATLGYTHNPLKRKGEKEIIIDPERFDLVKKMFDLMLTGTCLPPKILEIATDDWGLRNRIGKKVAKSTIYRIFNDPFYYGMFEYPKNSGNWYQGAHKPMITEDQYDRIQSLLGRKGKPRPKKHHFTFTGLMTCGECGAMITAEKKIKRQKNGNVHRYIYYHCTKRINPKCTQKCIEEKKLKEQIMDVIDKIQIPPEFHDWTMDELSLENKEQAKDNDLIINNQQKAYDECVKEIKGMIGMRARKELDEETYVSRMDELNKEKVRLKGLLAGANKKNQESEKLEKVFDFARDAKNDFESNVPERQKQLLANLGSNLLFIDRKLRILDIKPLMALEKISQEVRTIHQRLEPIKNGINKRTLGEIYAQSPTLLRAWNKVRTWYFDFNYPQTLTIIAIDKHY